MGISAAALGSWSAAEPTAAWFTDSVEGTLAISVGCDDRHENDPHTGNANHSGNAHNRCHGNDHPRPPAPVQAASRNADDAVPSVAPTDQIVIPDRPATSDGVIEQPTPPESSAALEPLGSEQGVG